MPAGPIQFDEFSLDCDRFELLRSGRPIKLEKIPMELLILLASKDGNLVTRDEIIERLWGKDVFVDTEHGINTAIRKIRLALRDDPEKPRFVQTVTGKGYRFIAEKRNDAETDGPRVEPEPGRSHLAGHTTRIALATVAAIVIAGLVFASNLGGVRDKVFAKQRVAPIHSIAVLPLANLSGDPSQDYYADGMTDELTTALARNRSLRVVSRTSAMQFKGVSRPLHEIAQSLGVDGILEGSVNRSGNGVHINLQLIYAPTDTHVWAHSYDRNLDSAMSLPEELSQTIASAAKADSAPPKPLSVPTHTRRICEAAIYGSLPMTSRAADSISRKPSNFSPIMPQHGVAWLTPMRPKPLWKKPLPRRCWKRLSSLRVMLLNSTIPSRKHTTLSRRSIFLASGI